MPAKDFIDAAPSAARALERCFQVYAVQTHLGARDAAGSYVWRSYADTGLEAACLAAGLAAPEGPVAIPRRGSVALCGGNRSEWLLADFACLYNDSMNTGIQEAWGQVKINQVLADAGASVAIVGTGSGALLLAAAKRSGDAPTLTHIVYMDGSGYGGAVDAAVKAAGLAACTYPEVVALGRRVFEGRAASVGRGHTHSGAGFAVTEQPGGWGEGPASHLGSGSTRGSGGESKGSGAGDVSSSSSSPSSSTSTSSAGVSSSCAWLEDKDDPEEIFTLIYTSGSSGGAPKAVATSKAVWRSTNCNSGYVGQLSSPDERRVCSYMSLAHGSDRGVCWFTSFAGGRVGFCRGEDGATGHAALLDDMRQVKPTFLLAFPNLWTDLYAMHKKKLDAAADALLLNSPFLDLVTPETTSAALRGLPAWDSLRSALLATRRGGVLRLRLLRLAREAMGNSLIIGVTGGSFTGSDVMRFISDIMTTGNEVRVVNSYGASEFPGIASATLASEWGFITYVPTMVERRGG